MAHNKFSSGNKTHNTLTRLRERELKTRTIYECRCDERLKTKVEESTSLACTGLPVELEHLKIETTLINEMPASVTGECEFLK